MYNYTFDQRLHLIFLIILLIFNFSLSLPYCYLILRESHLLPEKQLNLHPFLSLASPATSPSCTDLFVFPKDAGRQETESMT